MSGRADKSAQDPQAGKSAAASVRTRAPSSVLAPGETASRELEHPVEASPVQERVDRSPMLAAQARTRSVVDASPRLTVQRQRQGRVDASPRVAAAVRAPAVRVVQREGEPRAPGVAAVARETLAAADGLADLLDAIDQEFAAAELDVEADGVGPELHAQVGEWRRNLQQAVSILGQDADDQYVGDLEPMVYQVRGAVAAQLADIQGAATEVAREAHQEKNEAGRDLLLGFAADATAARGPLAGGEAPEPGEARGRRKDTAHLWLLDVPAGVNDALVGLGSGGAAIGDMAAAGTVLGSGSTAMTAVGAVAGSLGVLFGALAVGLGINAAVRGASKERQLGELIDEGLEKDVAGMARYAKEQKRKKKWGGAIGITLGAGAIAAGVLGLVALGASTMGIGAAILGIGMAAMGLGVVLGKWIHKKRKRKAFQEQIDGMADGLLQDALAEGAGSAAYQTLASWGVPIEDTDTARQRARAEARSRVESKRELMAASLLAYLVGPPSPAAFDAERVVEVLGLDPDRLREMYAGENPATAQSRIAAKLASW